jgi:methyl-accepting chemotaxis protein
MATLSIKVKVSGVTIVCLGLFGASLVILFNASYRKNVETLSQQSLANARSTYANLEKADVDRMSAAAELLMVNPSLRQIFTALDRERLIAETQPIYQSLKARYGVTILNFIDTEEKRFLTMTDTKDTRLIGTKAVRFNVQESARIKNWVTGLALGQLGFALRVIHPFYDTGTLKGDKLLGYIELGSEINGFMDSLKKQTGHEYGLIVRKKYLKEVDWKIQRERLKLRDNWADQKESVLAANTWKDESIFTFDGEVTALPDQGKTLGIVDKDGIKFSRSVFPIKDASGSKVGAVFLLVDITLMFSELAAAKRWTVGATVGLIVFICLILLLMLSRLVFRRLTEITRVAIRLVGGDYKTPMVISARDEIGKFEELFEQLRLVFINLMEEYEKTNRVMERKEKE